MRKWASVLLCSLTFSACSDPKQTAPNDTASDADIHIDGGADTSSTDQSERDAVFDIDISLASDFEAEAPGTVGIVTWSIQNVSPEAAEIQFGLDENYGMVAPVDLSEPNFRTLLLGMKPNQTYHFRVVATQGGNDYSSEDHTLETGPATNLVNVTATVDDPDAHTPGFLVSTYIRSPSPTQPMDDFLTTGSMIFILDSDGDVVWWYQSKVGLTPRARMSYDGKAMWLVPEREDHYGAAIERVSMDTLDSTVYDSVDGASHDGAVVDGAVFAYIDYGESDCNSVFELAPDGSETELFESADYFPGLMPPLCHLNAVRYNETKQLYSVSDREHDIFVINRQGEVQWRLTDIVPNETYGAEQHGHQLLSESILIFANAGGEYGSAAIEFSLADGSEIFRYEPGFRSIWYGDVQRLPGGNTWVTFSIAGVMQEVDQDGNRVMDIRGDLFGYTEWRASLYGPPFDIRQ